MEDNKDRFNGKMCGDSVYSFCTSSHQTEDFPDQFCKDCTHFTPILGGFCEVFGSFVSTGNKWWCPFYVDKKEVENE